MENFRIVRSFYDRKPRLLKIVDEGIRFENTNLKSNPFTEIKKDQITGLRYGTAFINGFEFTNGRIYCNYIKSENGKEIKIDFKLFYGIKLQEKHNLYCDIVASLWENIFSDFTNNLIQKIHIGETVELAGVLVKNDTILFDKTEIDISDLAIKKYRHYFVLHSKQNQNTNKMLYYLKDSNSLILLEILTDIILKNEQ